MTLAKAAGHNKLVASHNPVMLDAGYNHHPPAQTMTPGPNIEHMTELDETEMDALRRAIGRREQAGDNITPGLIQRFRATLDGHTELHADCNHGMHWCLATPAIAHDALGEDGHPARGGFLPAVPLPRRMWASSRILFYEPPAEGAAIERTSTISDVKLKRSASSGALVFVQVDHVHTQAEQVLIEERQSIVYRGPATTARQEPKNASPPSATPLDTITVIPDSRLLFRYSAMTFNAHRIHYDKDYATGVEGYPGLLVQGPLLATLLMNLAQARRPHDVLQAFEFRAVAPAFVDQPLELCIMDEGAGSLEVRGAGGALVMSASAQFA